MSTKNIQSKEVKKPDKIIVAMRWVIILALIVGGATVLGTCLLGDDSTEKPAPTQAPTEPEAPSYEPKLQLLSWSNYTEYGYIHVVGEVRNISNSKLEHVLAVVTFRTENGTLVKTDDALINYDPLMPGQSSPFKVLTTENPAIKKLSLGFKHLLGGEIKYRK